MNILYFIQLLSFIFCITLNRTLCCTLNGIIWMRIACLIFNAQIYAVYSYIRSLAVCFAHWRERNSLIFVNKLYRNIVVRNYARQTNCKKNLTFDDAKYIIGVMTTCRARHTYIINLCLMMKLFFFLHVVYCRCAFWVHS